MLDWHFKRLTPDCPTDTGIAERNFRRESTDLPEIFIRELLQNLMDARRPDFVGPLRLKIRMIDKSNGLNEEYLKKIIATANPHLVGAGHVDGREGPPKVLVIEEFGSTGLEGKVDDSRAEGESERWANFWHGEGKVSKGGKSLGRAGQGKITYHMVSAARTVLAYSVRGKAKPAGCVFGKCIVSKSHQIAADYFMRHGYWCEGGNADPGKPIQPLPTADPKAIAEFVKAFSLSRTADETGTSWVIPYPLESVTPEALTRAALRGFYYSIFKGALEIEVGTLSLNRKTASQLISEYVDDSAISKRFVHFIERVANGKSAAYATAGDDWWNGATEPLNSSCFSEEAFQKLKLAFDSSEPISVTFPLTLTGRDNSVREVFFRVFLQKLEGLQRTEEIYVRSDLVIGDEKWLKDAPGRALGATIADDEYLSEFLGYAEEASHLKWNAAEEELLRRYSSQSAKENLSRVRRALPKLSRLLTGYASGIEEDALIELLSVPDPAGAKKKSTGPGEKKKKPTGIKPGKIEPRPKAFSISDIAGGVRITPGDLPLKHETEAEILFAYARVAGEGNPFASYHPFDFDMADFSRIKVEEVKGIKVIEREENRLGVRIDDPDFDLRVTGFSDNQRMICKARLMEAEA
jgi:hypothetical protein